MSLPSSVAHGRGHHLDFLVRQRVTVKEEKPAPPKKEKSVSLADRNLSERSESKKSIQPVAVRSLSKSRDLVVPGTKRALLIGINYIISPANKLNGCINDVQSIKELLMSKFGYKEENIRLMSDNQRGINDPTRANIIDAINKIVSETKPGDTLFFHYSGHGTLIKDKGHNEDNNPDTPGQDSCLCPADFAKIWSDDESQIFITDALLKEILVNKIPKGARAICFVDACHSSTILDLSYVYKQDNEFYYEYPEDLGGHNVICISGSRDSGTSADAWNSQRRKAMGALTMALIQNLSNIGAVHTTWKDLLLLVRHTLLLGGYDQIAQLSVAEKALADEVVDI